MAALDPRLSGAEVVVSVSGGKDSAATSLYLTELGIEHRRMERRTEVTALGLPVGRKPCVPSE